MKMTLKIHLFAILMIASLQFQMSSCALLYGRNTNLSDVDASFLGEVEQDAAGKSVSMVGDVNGDGFDDLLIGADYNDDSGFYAGKAYLIFGKKYGWNMDTFLNDADASFTGTESENLGQTVAGAGDVNGDGFDDFMIAVRGYNMINKLAGKVYLFLGRRSGWSRNMKATTADATFLGEAKDDFAGWSLDGAGDVNGDGFDDILIGAPGPTSERRTGKTYLIFGKASGWSHNTSLFFADAYYQGGGSGDSSGTSVAGAGDVNGDGFDDFLIGSPYNDETPNDSGQAYLIFGKGDGWSRDNHLSVSGASFRGEDHGDFAGGAVGGAGDVNGDGFDDILIGAGRAEAGGEITTGQAYLFLGGSEGWQMDISLTEADASFLGEDKHDWAGDEVCGAGDINGDGYDDFLVGAYANEGGYGTKGGQTYLILGKRTGWSINQSLSLADASFLGERDNDNAGQSISGGGDINGDGYDDILIGAPGNDEFGGDWRGQIYVIFPDKNSIPHYITSLKAFSDEEFNNEIIEADLLDRVFIELKGQDGNISRSDVVTVNVTSNCNPHIGFKLRLFETGNNTGTYRGNITIAHRTHERNRWINSTNGGWVRVFSPSNLLEIVNLSIGEFIRIDEKPSVEYAEEDEYFNHFFSSSGVEAESWEFRSDASWLDWNSVTHNISGTPDNSHVGSYWVNIEVEGDGLFDSSNFTLVVRNSPPQITTTDIVRIDQDKEYLVDYDCSDDDQGTITWHLNTNASWLNLNNITGVLNGTPKYDHVGSTHINISVDDGNGGWASSEFDLEVGNINDAPILLDANIAPKQGNISVPYTFSVIYVDVDGDEPTEIEVFINGSGFTMSPSRNLDYSSGVTYQYTTYLSEGHHVYHFLASDGIDQVRFPDKGNLSTTNIWKPSQEIYDIIPPTINLLHPLNGTIINTSTVELRWDVENRNQGTMLTYDLYFGVDEDKVSGLHESMLYRTDILNKSIGIDGLLNNITYYWTIAGRIQGVRDSYLSEVNSFRVDYHFMPVHNVDIHFEVGFVELVSGKTIDTNLVLNNSGNLAEIIYLNVQSELEEHITIERIIYLGPGEEISIPVRISSNTNLEPKTYHLTIVANYSTRVASANLNIEIIAEDSGGPFSNPGNDKGSFLWLWIAVPIFVLFIMASFFFIFLKNRTTDEEEEWKVVKDDMIKPESPSPVLRETRTSRFPSSAASARPRRVRSERKPVSPSMEELIPGYILTHRIGSGGFAAVYRALNYKGDPVAIKVPKHLDETVDIKLLESFRAESDIWKKLKHRNIVTFHEGDIRPVPYLVIEYMEGGNLHDVLRKGPLPIRKASFLIKEILSGMAYAHRMASVHRDIKPENILFTRDGIPKVSDWGIGKFMASESGTKSIGIKGTLAYCAPEQVSKEEYGEVDWCTDVFQLGVVFYEILTGENPFYSENPIGIINNIINRDPAPPSSVRSGISPEIDAMILRALEKDKGKRFRSADAMLEKFEECSRKR